MENQNVCEHSGVKLDSPLVEAAEAVAATVADPSPLNIINDLELAYKLLNEFRDAISGLHPSVSNLFKAMF